MYHNLYGQINWGDLDDQDQTFGVMKEFNYLMLTGIVYKHQIPGWNDLITYDPDCLHLEFVPENLWTCKNRQYSYQNSESFRYWLKVEIIGFDCDRCITINGHPEYGRICFDEGYTVKAYINNSCDEDIFGHAFRNIDEEIKFVATVSFNKNPEWGPIGTVPPGLNGKISTKYGSRDILLYFDSLLSGL